MQQQITTDPWGKIIHKEPDIDRAQLPPVIRRLEAYNLHEQLAALYDDIQAGLFGEAAKHGKFVGHVSAVKQAHPKE